MRCDPFGDRIAVLGNLDGRGEHFIQFLLAEAIEELLPAIDGTGDGGRFDAALRSVVKTFLLQTPERLRGRHPSAGIDAVKFSSFRVIDDGEQIATDTVPHGSDNGHYGVSGDGCIDGIASARQNGSAGLRSERRFRSDHARLRDHHRTPLAAFDRVGLQMRGIKRDGCNTSS